MPSVPLTVIFSLHLFFHGHIIDSHAVGFNASPISVACQGTNQPNLVQDGCRSIQNIPVTIPLKLPSNLF